MTYIPIKVAQSTIDANVPHFNNNRVNGISVLLMSDCNLNCDFCLERFYESDKGDPNSYTCQIQHQKYNTLPKQLTIDNIIKAQDNVRLVINRLGNGAEKYSFSLLGGELFQDKYKQDVFDQYTKLIASTFDVVNENGGQCRWNLMTNLITKHPQRIIDLASKYSPLVVINASFDFKGRFKSQKVIDLWMKNIQAVKQSGVRYCVIICMSNPNIQAIINDDKDWIDLYNSHPIRLEQFQDVGDSQYKPSTDILTQLYIKLHQCYPKVLNVGKQSQFFASCVSVFPDSISWQCCDHTAMMNKFHQSKRCLACEYFTDCELQDCYLVNDMSTADCHIKRYKEYLSEASRR